MKNSKNAVLTVAALTISLSLTACGKSEKNEGSAEKAGATMGKAIDQATEQAGEAMEKAVNALKETGDKAKEAVKMRLIR
jgi:uncharacterized lipoprotein YehR (DUF1307 family)